MGIFSWFLSLYTDWAINLIENIMLFCTLCSVYFPAFLSFANHKPGCGKQLFASKTSKVCGEEILPWIHKIWFHNGKQYCWAWSTVCWMWWNPVKWVIKPLKLQRHLTTNNLGCVAKLIFPKEKGWATDTKVIITLTTQSKSTLKDIYMVAACVAHSNKCFAIAAELILPSAVDMCRELLGWQLQPKFSQHHSPMTLWRWQCLFIVSFCKLLQAQ